MTKPPFDNKQQTLGKAVITALLGQIAGQLDQAGDAFFCSKNKSKKDEDGKSPIEQVLLDMKDIANKIVALNRQIKESLAEETTLGREYDQELFEQTISTTRDKVMKRFAHQPNISATLDMFILLLHTDLHFNAHCLNLRTQCAVEDRQKNSSCYDVNGEVNAKGRNECDHCPHLRPSKQL